MLTATAKTEENWDDDFEDSRHSPKKIIQRHREESWDDEDDENSEFADKDPYGDCQFSTNRSC